jgi:LPS sulfotransferase NodH
MKDLRALLSPPLKKRIMDAGLFGQSDYTAFIILARSRVGSNLLRGLLNAHSQITAYGEVFRARDSMDWDHTGYFQSDAMRALVQHDPVRFVDAKLLGRYPVRTRAVGFKLFYYHARGPKDAPVWTYLRERRDVKVIHLTRRNLLETHLSRKRAALTERWVDTAGQPDRAAVAIDLDYDECRKDFEQTRIWEEECGRFFDGHSKLDVHYERLAEDYGAESSRIQAFLGVPIHSVKPSTFRQAQQPLSAVIANYGDLKARFRGTPWEQFFTA